MEIWNEQNLIQNFYPQIDPARYTQLLQAAHTAIKAVSPSMPVISGGLSGYPGDGVDGAIWAAKPYLTSMYADGAGTAMDAIGLHVYPTIQDSSGQYAWSAAGFGTMLDDVLAARSQGHGTQPVWITEAGESTATESGWPTPVSGAQQATDLQAMIAAAQTNAAVRMILIDTVEDAPSSYGVLAGLGVFTNQGKPKPAACALSKQFGGSLHC